MLTSIVFAVKVEKGVKVILSLEPIVTLLMFAYDFLVLPHTIMKLEGNINHYIFYRQVLYLRSRLYKGQGHFCSW